MNSERTEERSEQEEPTTAQAEASVEGTEEGAETGAGAAGEREQPDGAPEAARDRREVEELNDRYLRLAAEFDNYRRRTQRERAESSSRAQADLVKHLLEPLDDLRRVVEHATDAGSAEALLEGVRMVERKLLRVLEGAGLEGVEAGGKPFDPEQHEALMTAPTDDPDEDDTVGAVFQDGYLFKGVLLRPARVQVRKYEG